MQTWELTDADYQRIADTCALLYVKALKDMPPDVRAALQRALEKETVEIGRKILSTIIENIRVADEQDLLLCQDTGLPVYWVRAGNQVRFDGMRVEQAIRDGTLKATMDYSLRSSVVNAITRQNYGTNTGEHVPVIHWEFVEGDTLTITALPKGSGSENMSFLKCLIPADGLKGIKRFVLECVVESGANPCPPTIVGVGIGGSADLCSVLAKKAVLRPVGQPNPDPSIAALEEELLDAINRTGLGANGLGGAITALAVHIEKADTHMTMNPVAVNMMCWENRRATGIFGPSEQVEITY